MSFCIRATKFLPFGWIAHLARSCFKQSWSFTCVACD